MVVHTYLDHSPSSSKARRSACISGSPEFLWTGPLPPSSLLRKTSQDVNLKTFVLTFIDTSLRLILTSEEAVKAGDEALKALCQGLHDWIEVQRIGQQQWHQHVLLPDLPEEVMEVHVYVSTLWAYKMCVVMSCPMFPAFEIINFIK
ncbi:hypothetical protein GUJ93_ZPchr0010g8045 [Zizania palustris]|uniref:Uncharacterized protein n=1 Tax=Zizania palustris TaxID=103762 RepID=A0A8J5WEB5_ZIZPA|nr:hypothetical protein GUJ93_ZPchr0010g8045 [Zizania palustris]